MQIKTRIDQWSVLGVQEQTTVTLQNYNGTHYSNTFSMQSYAQSMRIINRKLLSEQVYLCNHGRHKVKVWEETGPTGAGRRASIGTGFLAGPGARRSLSGFQGSRRSSTAGVSWVCPALAQRLAEGLFVSSWGPASSSCKRAHGPVSPCYAS